MKKIFKSVAVVILGLGSLLLFYSCNDEEQQLGSNVSEVIPNELTYYEIDMQGTTWSNFSRKGCLYVTKAVENATNFNNGINPREVGIVSGFPAGNPEAGAMWLFTNTNLCQYGSTGCNSIIRDANIDIAFVTVNEENRSISIELDGQLYNNTGAGTILTSNNINHFTSNSGLFATIYRTITGTINIKFSEDGNSISGSINIEGNNFSGTGTAPYRANFTGEKVLLSANSCR